jgi:hypothetical protein
VPIKWSPGCNCCETFVCNFCVRVENICSPALPRVTGATVTITAGATTVGTCTTTGMVTGVFFSNHGSGYDPSDPPTVTFSGGGGSGATGVPVLSGGTIASVAITDGGSGYTSVPTVTFTTTTGSGAVATAQVTVQCCIPLPAFGSFTVSASATGYHAATKSVTPSSASFCNTNIQLYPVQDAVYNFHITDLNTALPLAGALVTLNDNFGNSYTCTTNASGNCSISFDTSVGGPPDFQVTATGTVAKAGYTTGTFGPGPGPPGPCSIVTINMSLF